MCDWSAPVVALWFAVLLAILGAIGGLVAIGFVTFGVGQSSQGFAVSGALAGLAAGFVAGFTGVYGGSIQAAPSHLVIALIVGVVSAMIISSVCILFEAQLLDFRQFRRPSRRPDDAKLRAILAEVGETMAFKTLPKLRISDGPVPGAWTHASHIVLSKGLLNQNAAQ